MKLVTGGTGFLGSALVSALVAGNVKVRCVSRRHHPEIEVAGAEYVTADLSKIDPQNQVFDSVDTIIHLASTTIPSTSMNDVMFDAHSNLDMALRLLECARVRGVNRFVFASSGGTVYGDPVRLPARENDPTEPRSSYGIIKLTIEKYIALYTRLYGIQGISLRIANPYGTGQLRGTPIGIIARLLQDVRAGKTIPIWGDGSTVRDFFHIDDLVRAFLIAVTTGLKPGVYNVASGRGTSVREIIGLAERVVGRPISVDYQPARTIDVGKIWLDTEKFRMASGWQAEIGLEDGIRALWKELLKT